MDKPFSGNQTWLECIACGYRTDLLKERKFACPDCGNLYDVEHDLSGSSFGDLISLFDRRAGCSFASVGLSDGRKSLLGQSGVWRFKELIMPYLPDNHIVTLGEGNVPIVPAGRHLREWIGPVDLWLILEGMTPTGSFKDFGGTVMMSVAKAAGIKTIGCASTGDTSAMAAAYASAAGIDCTVILPEGKVTPAQLAQPLVHGAKVITLPGTFDDCMRVVKELVNTGRLFPANSINPTRIEGHQATVFLLAQFFGWELPDWIALPVGNGSNCSSVGKAMRLMKELGYKRDTSRILGCQSTAARPLATSWRALGSAPTAQRWSSIYLPMDVGETTATAARIGNPASYRKVIREIIASNGMMDYAPEELLNEAVGVCGRDGFFVCPQTGTALACLKQAVARGEIEHGASVAVVSTANGLKFTESAAAKLMKEIIPARDCQTETVAKILGL
jgi:threonine synthase